MTTERKQHIGYRVVRTNPETGKREWLSVSVWLPRPPTPWEPNQEGLARALAYARRNGGRVVRVTLKWRE